MISFFLPVSGVRISKEVLKNQTSGGGSVPGYPFGMILCQLFPEAVQDDQSVKTSMYTHLLIRCAKIDDISSLLVLVSRNSPSYFSLLPLVSINCPTYVNMFSLVFSICSTYCNILP